jgi:hypothetical protein
MWAKRAEQLRDVSLTVDVDPLRCLDTADFLARHAADYGIKADLELRRSHTGRAYARHTVLCHQAGTIGRVAPANTKPLWIMHLVIASDHPGTRVVLGLHTYRRWGRGVEAGRVAEDYRQLLLSSLSQLDLRRRIPRTRRDNVVALRPFAALPPTGTG